jgi:hypothetical protein
MARVYIDGARLIKDCVIFLACTGSDFKNVAISVSYKNNSLE